MFGVCVPFVCHCVKTPKRTVFRYSTCKREIYWGPVVPGASSEQSGFQGAVVALHDVVRLGREIGRPSESRGDDANTAHHRRTANVLARATRDKS